MKNIFLFITLALGLFACAEDDDLSELFKDTVAPDQQHDESASADPTSEIGNEGVLIKVLERPDHFQFLEQLWGANNFELKSTNVPDAVTISESGVVEVYDPLAFDASTNPTIELIVRAYNVSGEEQEVPIQISVEEVPLNTTTVLIDEIIDRSMTISTVSFQKDTFAIRIDAEFENQSLGIAVNTLPEVENVTKRYIVAPTETTDENFATIVFDEDLTIFNDTPLGSYGYINITRGANDIFEIQLVDVLFKDNETEDSYDIIEDYTFNAVDRSASFVFSSDFINGPWSVVSTFEEVDNGANIQFGDGFITIPKGSTSGTYEVTDIESSELNGNQASVRLLITTSSSRRYVGINGSIDLVIEDGLYIFSLGSIDCEQTFPGASNVPSRILSGSLRY